MTKRISFLVSIYSLPSVITPVLGCPEEVQGLSVRPLAEGRDAPWRDYAYIESNYWGRAVVTERYKYVTEYKPTSNSKFGVEDFHPPGPDADQLGFAQLFDRHDDPGETENLAQDTNYREVIETCREKLFTQEARLHRQQNRASKSQSK